MISTLPAMIEANDSQKKETGNMIQSIIGDADKQNTTVDWFKIPQGRMEGQ